ncbi:MAG: hypothetical protein IT212_07615 [Bacteroidia bacterium]|nr:hypothetical protein [Bacteroidia bacterium]
MAKVISAAKLINSSPKRLFKGKRVSVKIVEAFFKEALNIMIEGESIRFPKSGNGKLFLAIKSRKTKDIASLKYLKRDTIKSVFGGAVKPVLQGFEVGVGGKDKDVKRFGLRFSYPRLVTQRLNKAFAEDKQRRKLPEIK